MVINSNFYMNLALEEAWKYQGLTYPNPAVGCCVVGANGEVLAVEAHKKAGNPHAEVEALKSAYYKLTNDENILYVDNSADIHNFLIKNHNNLFKNCSVYTTLEPCSHVGKTPACADLLNSLDITKVYIGSSDSYQDDFSGAEFGVLRKECDELLAPFNKWQKKNFVFFKWAQRLDGSTDGGIVSSKDSRKKVHAMRNVCDLLVIGGNTVRVDRPTLDARLVDGKAPDILIISREQEFDKTISLFNVKNRKVIVSDNFSTCKDYKNIMVEGTVKMFELSADIIDSYLCFIAPSVGGGNSLNKINEKFSILNIQKEEQDIIMWMKKEI